MMGVGKSTVGHLLARRLGWRYLDSDEQVQAETGRTVPEIMKEDGEAAFRRAETRVLCQALAKPGPEIVSVAGGAVLDPSNREAIRSAGHVVWLRAKVSTLADRVGDGRGRPLLERDPRGVLAELDSVRRPLYEEVAHEVVDVDELSPEEVADRVVQLADPVDASPGSGPRPGRP
jgi:shikimate kinase